MEIIRELTQINYLSVIISIFIVLFGAVTIIEVIGKISVYIGKPVRWIRNKNKDHETIDHITNAIDEIKKQQDTDREQSIKHDEKIQKDLESLAGVFFDKMLEDMRWRILDFASAVSDGRKFNRESYDFIIRTYDKYEKILEERNETNGLIDETIKFVKNKYQEQLEQGEL